MAAVRMAYNEFKPREVHSNEVQRHPVIVLHGMFWNKEMFTDLSKLLAETLQRTVYALDLRNHLDSPAPKDCSCELMAIDLELFMEERGIEQVSIICHSFSASVSHMFGIRNPKAIEKLVIVDRTPYYIYEDVTDSCQTQVVAQNRFLKQLDQNMSLGEAKLRLMNHISARTKGQKLFLKKVAIDLMKENGKFKWKTDIDFLLKKAEDRALVPPKYLGIYNGEMLIVKASESSIVTEERFQNDVLPLNPKAKMITLENASHLVLLEEPLRFAKEMKKYLNGEN